VQHQQDKDQQAPKEEVYQLQQMGLNQQTASMPPAWQSLAAPGSTVADYLSHLPASTLPISLHHFLKYSAESIKKETESTVILPQSHPITQVINVRIQILINL